jgi:cytochrome c556
MIMRKRLMAVALVALAALLGASAVAFAAELKDVLDVLPKFAIPMREVGDRFQNMYFAAKAGNWGLAFYMSKYMNGAMNPAKVTKPDEYPLWSSFYTKKFEPVNKAIVAKDVAAFEKEYTAVIKECNACHTAMGYGFIKVVKQKTPSDQGIDYKVPSKAEDVPK